MSKTYRYNLFNQRAIKRRCELQTILYVLHQKTYSRFIHRGNVIDNGIFSRYNRDFKKLINTGELSSAYVSAMKKFPYPQVHFHNQIRFLSNDKRRSIEINKKIIDLGKDGNYEMLKNLINNNLQDFNQVNIATALNRLSWLSMKCNIDAKLINLLVTKIEIFVDQFNRQELSNICNACAKLGRPIPISIMDRLNNLTSNDTKRFTSQELALVGN
eukprot:g13677.t1